jgi:hypothetical protein
VTEPSPRSATLDLPSDPALFSMTRTFIVSCGAAWSIDDERIEDGKLAVSELLAFASGPRVRISLELDREGSIWIRCAGVRRPDAEDQDDLRLRLLGAIASELRWDDDEATVCFAADPAG